jgi:PPOX class probable F420-dependent enzyme
MTDQTVPQKYLDLFKKPAFAHLATLMPDGSPQVTPVWVDYDGKFILVNTARGRQKDRNMKRDARVAIEVMDPENPYRYLQVRGKVIEITTEGANQHIDKLSQKYTGNEHYQNRRAGEVRVIYKIEPENL